MRHIALIAKSGAGKGDFYGVAQRKYGYFQATMSSYIELAAKKAGMLKKGETLDDRIRKAEVSNAMAERFGNGYLAKAVVEDMESRENNGKFYVIDGIRRRMERNIFQSAFKSDVVFVGIVVDEKVLEKRLVARDKDIIREMGVGNYLMKMRQSQGGYDIDELLAGVDRKIENNGTREEFEEKVAKFINEYCL